MIVLAIVCSLLGAFFQQELAKQYNPHDMFANSVPRVLSTALQTLGGGFWAIYIIQEFGR